MFTSVDEPFLFTSCIKFGLLDMPFLIMEYNIINYTINEDGYIDVDGNVNLYRKLTKLPLNFNKVTGYFNCDYKY